MSADLLRRAAKALRVQAARLPEPWATRAWRSVQTDTESIDGIAACVNDHDDDPHGAFDCCWSSESVGHEAVAALVVLMHPPVALALAEWLELEANREAHYLAEFGYRVAPAQVAALARAVLREEECREP